MIPLETTEVKASDLKVGDRFFDEYGDMWTLKHIEIKGNGYLNLWFDNLEGTESFYPIRKDDMLPKVVEMVKAPLSSMPDPLNSDIDEPNYGDGIPESDKGGAAVDPVTEESTTPVDFEGKDIDACLIGIRDRITVTSNFETVHSFTGVVVKIHINPFGKISLTFSDGVYLTVNSTEKVKLLERDCMVEPGSESVGLVAITLRLDNNPDAQNAIKAYALYIRNTKPELSQAILAQLTNIQTGIPPFEVM